QAHRRADRPGVHAGKADHRRVGHGADRRYGLARRRPRRARRQPRENRAGRRRQPDGGGGLSNSLAPPLRGRDERSSLLEGWGEGLYQRPLMPIDRPVPPHPSRFARRPLPASGGEVNQITESFRVKLAPSLGEAMQRQEGFKKVLSELRQAIAAGGYQRSEEH